MNVNIIGMSPSQYYVDIANELANMLPDHQITIISKEHTGENGMKFWMIHNFQIDGQDIDDVAYLFEQYDRSYGHTPKETAEFFLSVWEESRTPLE